MQKKEKYVLSQKLFKLVFPHCKNLDSLVKIDKKSIKYITFAHDADLITQFIADNVASIIFNGKSLLEIKDLVITDITAGVGGNVFSFAKQFKYVNAIEIDKLRFEYLQNNVNAYQLENVNCYNINCLELTLKNDLLRQDIIFFDPPWGGSTYKQVSNLRLLFENISIEEISLSLINQGTTMIVLKLPLNYDFDYLQHYFKHCFYKQQIFGKLVIVLITNK